MKKLAEYIISVIVVGLLISTTASDIQVEGKTDFTTLNKSASFWIIITLMLLFLVFQIVKRKISEIYNEYLTKLEGKISKDLEINIQRNVTKSIKSSVVSILKSEMRREVKEAKRDFKEDLEGKFDNFIDTKLNALIILEVNKELEKVQSSFSDKIELTVLRHLQDQQKPNEEKFSLEQLAEIITNQSSMKKVGVE